jgi:hypothetical protein
VYKQGFMNFNAYGRHAVWFRKLPWMSFRRAYSTC